MIRARYNEQEYCLTVSGHAGYGPMMQDIVCAGVSAICDALLGTAAEYSHKVYPRLMKRASDNSIRVKLQPNNERNRAAARLMLDMAYTGLERIEQQYPEYIQCCRTEEGI
ncbi:MAG: ribosomal-processing cysteine protease Prp [Oscillospiraceae bacterium]|nr:ribosomal-processing cysteine protease Prp [Oscillospiraceae bacterium]